MGNQEEILELRKSSVGTNKTINIINVDDLFSLNNEGVFLEIMNETILPIAGYGSCGAKDCGCTKYRKSDPYDDYSIWCKCGHHIDTHF